LPEYAASCFTGAAGKNAEPHKAIETIKTNGAEV